MSLCRSGASNPLGKLSAKVECRVSEDTRDELDRLARECGMGLSEYVRELLMIRAHGVDMVRTLYQRHLEMVVGMSVKTYGDV